MTAGTISLAAIFYYFSADVRVQQQAGMVRRRMPDVLIEVTSVCRIVFRTKLAFYITRLLIVLFKISCV